MAAKSFCADSRSLNMHRLGVLFLVLFLGAFTSYAQTPESTPPPDDDTKPITVKTDLVTLTLTVTDLYGRYVSGLSKNAFTVSDNNVEQEIQSEFCLMCPIR
jgi:hypothetical protein